MPASAIARHLAAYALQIYIPKLPGVPNEMAAYPDRYHMDYEVSSCTLLEGRSCYKDASGNLGTAPGVLRAGSDFCSHAVAVGAAPIDRLIKHLGLNNALAKVAIAASQLHFPAHGSRVAAPVHVSHLCGLPCLTRAQYAEAFLQAFSAAMAGMLRREQFTQGSLFHSRARSCR